MPPSKGCFYLFAAGPGSAPEGLLPRREGLMARREDNFPCGIRIIFDSITYYLLHYWEFYLSREDVKPLPQGHSWIDPGDDIDLTAIPLWVRVCLRPGGMNLSAEFNATTGLTEKETLLQ